MRRARTEPCARPHGRRQPSWPPLEVAEAALSLSRRVTRAAFEPPFLVAICDGRHGATRGVVLNALVKDAGRPGVSKMSYHQRPHELRLAISSEAEALMSDFGGDAYAEACRRAGEASNDSLARDWSSVAATIARRSGWRSSVLDALFG
jgi:hypothetical protein